MEYSFKECKRDNADPDSWQMIYICTPNFWARLIGYREHERIYIGKGTVWRRLFPDGNMKRCGIFDDSWLTDEFKREERRMKLRMAEQDSDFISRENIPYDWGCRDISEYPPEERERILEENRRF